MATDPSNDAEGPLFDIHQLFAQATDIDISFRITIYNPWPDEEFRRKNGLFVIYLDSDNNTETGDPDSLGADYLLSVGPDFLTERYVENLYQWADPEGLGLWDFYEIAALRKVNTPNSATLDVTVERSKIGNPSVINIFVETLNLDTFAADECPDVGTARYP